MNIAITIDTECDKGENWKVKHPLSFQNIHEGVAGFLQPLFDTYQIKPTYLLSPEVIRDSESAGYFKLLGDRVELGTHLHSEFIDPNANYLCAKTDTFQFELEPEIEYQKLTNLTQLFTNTFGYAPTSFRAGRFGISKHTLGYLQELGYKVDSSVTPDTWWMANKKHGVNFVGSPYLPYFPDKDDFRKAGKMSIIEVPVTTMNSKLKYLPNTLKRRLNPKKKWQRLLINKLTLPKANLHWFRPTYSSAEEMLHMVDFLNADYNCKTTEQHNNVSPTFVMMFHSNEFTLGTSPYSMDKKN